MIHHTTRKHRSAADWQTLIQQWQQSNLSAQAFCRQNQLGYASFCQWRKRLNTPADHSVAEASHDFIDVSGLASPPQVGSWHLWLKVGPWVELRLGRS